MHGYNLHSAWISEYNYFVCGIDNTMEFVDFMLDFLILFVGFLFCVAEYKYKFI